MTAKRRENTATTFVGMLLADDAVDGEIEALAEQLGFDRNAKFCVAVVADAGVQFDPSVNHVRAAFGGNTIVVVPDIDSEAMFRFVRTAPTKAHAGIGAIRDGLRGARGSVVDARQALTVAKVLGRTVRWEDCWWLAVLTEHVDQLRDVVMPTWTVARANTHLAEAVEAFATESFSSTRAARRLFVHPNTVIYRLRQWQRTTGSNPYSLAGLTSSICALTLGPLTDEDEQRAAG